MHYNPYELIYMIRTGDQVALEMLIEQYTPVINTFIKTAMITYPAYQPYVEDFRLEARMAVVDAVDTYRNDTEASFDTFLHVVLKRRISNLLRKHRSQAPLYSRNNLQLDMMVNEEESYYDLIEQKNPMNNPTYYTEYNMANERLEECINGLSTAERAVLECLRRRETYAEAAARLNCTTKAYDGKVQRVRRKIRKAVNGN